MKEQNTILGKVFRQDKKSLISPFACFLTATAKV